LDFFLLNSLICCSGFNFALAAAVAVLITSDQSIDRSTTDQDHNKQTKPTAKTTAKAIVITTVIIPKIAAATTVKELHELEKKVTAKLLVYCNCSIEILPLVLL